MDDATACKPDPCDHLGHYVRVKRPELPIDLDVAIVAIRFEPYEPVRAQKIAEAASIGAARGERIGFIYDQTGEISACLEHAPQTVEHFVV